jgi:hypothetical protein
LYSKGGTEAEAAAYGLTLEEATENETVYVWPDNLLAVNTFTAMSTQWRVGAMGATGLDYNALPTVMKMIGVPVKNRSEVFEDVRTMEDAALQLMRDSK